MDPVAAVRRAVEHERPAGPVAIIALGKAGSGMAQGALEALGAMNETCSGGIVVTDARRRHETVSLPIHVGDHPVPGDDSLRAAEALGEFVEQVDAPHVWVLLSGGTSSLIGAPVGGLSLQALQGLFRAASAAGLDIATMNALRRRFLRWGGGRLASALAPRRVQVFAISDVPGDDPRIIGSGPCAAEPLGVREFRAMLDGASIMARLPAEVRSLIEDDRSPAFEPLPPFLEPPHVVALRNADALDGAEAEARRLGFELGPRGSLAGEARRAGVMVGTAMRKAPPGTCMVWGGETTVTLGENPGRGGRAQELALAAAPLLAGSEALVLAAGTDGRDGPTDAAGAMVDGSTVAALRARGMSHEAALARHDAYPALDAVGALVRTGPTGTNVMDLAIGIVPR